MKRVLLINPGRRNFQAHSPHHGLSILATALKQHGHEVQVVDYSFAPQAPEIEYFVDSYDPDVVGVSMWTSVFSEGSRLIDATLSIKKIPVMVGGPHATLYYDDLLKDSRISYVVCGEAEEVITSLVENAKIETSPVLVEAQPVDVRRIPFADYTAVYDYQKARVCRIQLSRGCPFFCSFCEVHIIAGRKIRWRDFDVVIDDLMHSKSILPNLKSVDISDDCPTCNLKKFKAFLRAYIEAEVGLNVSVDNVRADRIDDETLNLLKKAGCSSIFFGVEHGDPDVFEMVSKGESLDDIRQGAKLVKKHDMKLGMCFVVGLPGDSVEKTRASINLAKELRADAIFWNMFVPHRGVRAREILMEMGARFYDERDVSSLMDPNLDIDMPAVETDDFTRDNRIKAWLMAMMETKTYFQIPVVRYPKLLKLSLKYGLVFQFLKFIMVSFSIRFWNIAIKLYRLVRRILSYIIKSARRLLSVHKI